MRGFIGQLEEGNLIPHTHNTFLYTHYDFYFQYNENRVCQNDLFILLVEIKFKNSLLKRSYLQM